MKDYFGVNTDFLKNQKLYLFDMDGTIYIDDVLIDGTLELLDEIEKRGARYIFVTNNSSKSVEDYIQRVHKLGIKADYDSFFTSSQATAFLLNTRFPNTKVYCQGTRSLVKELRSSGVDVTEEVEDDVGLILVGFDNEMTSEKLRKTCILLGRDVPYYATNPDLVCPVSFGYIPDCGSICIMLKNATGKEPEVIGKPKPLMVELAMKKFNVQRDETVIIGDRLYTDIATGVNAGITSICVLSGECTLHDVESGEVKPTLLFNSVKDIYHALID